MPKSSWLMTGSLNIWTFPSWNMNVFDSRNLAYEEDDIVMTFLWCWPVVVEIDGVKKACAEAAEKAKTKKCMIEQRLILFLKRWLFCELAEINRDYFGKQRWFWFPTKLVIEYDVWKNLQEWRFVSCYSVHFLTEFSWSVISVLEMYWNIKCQEYQDSIFRTKQRIIVHQN